MAAEVEISKDYRNTIQKAVQFYRQGRFEEESVLITLANGLFYPINCYSCLKRIEEKHIKIEDNGEKTRFHEKCIEERVKTNI